MRRYDDPVEVRKGPEEGPEQFMWRGKLWKVRAVLAHWVETGSWWQSADARAVIGTDDAGDTDSVADVRWSSRASVSGPVSRPGPQAGDLLRERELWRVEAAAGMRAPDGGGVFDLSFDWADGTWQLVGCLD
jgi:hypothetical protein